MKRLLLFTNILTLALLVWCFFSRHKWPPEEPSAACTTCYPVPCKDTFAGLNALLAKHMVRDYRTNHWARMFPYPPFSLADSIADSRSVWFSLATLKRFIYEIETKVCDSCGDFKQTLGVRIYYAEYPQVDSIHWAQYDMDPNLRDSIKGLHTVVMVPTYHNGEFDTDFDPGHFSQTGNRCRPMPIDSVFHQIVQADTFVVSTNRNLTFLTAQYRSATPDPNGTTETSVVMQNHGGLNPPPFTDQGSPTLSRECNGAIFMNVSDGFICR